MSNTHCNWLLCATNGHGLAMHLPTKSRKGSNSIRYGILQAARQTSMALQVARLMFDCNVTSLIMPPLFLISTIHDVRTTARLVHPLLGGYHAHYLKKASSMTFRCGGTKTHSWWCGVSGECCCSDHTGLSGGLERP